MSVNFVQRPDSYTLTLSLYRRWERGCGTDRHWRFSCLSSIWFRILDLDPDACTGSREFNGIAVIMYIGIH